MHARTSPHDLMAARVTSTLNGFTVAASDAGVEFRLFDAAGRHQQPLASIHDGGDVQAILMGRLYYRPELASALGLPGFSRAEDDAAFTAAVYRSQGIGGLERLEGEFALVVHDRREKRLIAIRDPLGGYPIYAPLAARRSR